MSKTALRCSAVLIASLAVGAAARAQTHESAIPNLASADFGWQHGFGGLNFQRVKGKAAPTGRGPVLPGIERLARDASQMGPAASVNRDAGLSEARDKFLTNKKCAKGTRCAAC